MEPCSISFLYYAQTAFLGFLGMLLPEGRFYIISTKRRYGKEKIGNTTNQDGNAY